MNWSHLAVVKEERNPREGKSLNIWMSQTCSEANVPAMVDVEVKNEAFGTKGGSPFVGVGFKRSGGILENNDLDNKKIGCKWLCIDCENKGVSRLCNRETMAIGTQTFVPQTKAAVHAGTAGNERPA